MSRDIALLLPLAGVFLWGCRRETPTQTVEVTVVGGSTGGSAPTSRGPDDACPTGSVPPQLDAEAPWVRVLVQNGFGCAQDREGRLTCFGEASEEINARIPREPVLDYAVGGGFGGMSLVCAIVASTDEIGCWSSSDEHLAPPAPEGGGWLMLAGDGTVWAAVNRDGKVYSWDGSYSTAWEGYVDTEDLSVGVDTVKKMTLRNGGLPIVLTRDGDVLVVGGIVLESNVVDIAFDEVWCYIPKIDLRPYCEYPRDWLPSNCPWVALDTRYIYTVGIRVDGSLEAGALPWDDMMDHPDLLPEGSFVSVSGDPRAGCALSTEGRLACWDYAGVLTRNVPE